MARWPELDLDMQREVDRSELWIGGHKEVHHGQGVDAHDDVP